MTSASTSVWEKASPPALALKPDDSVPPCMSLAPSLSESVSKFMCGLFKRNAEDSSSPPAHSAATCAGFHSQKLWGLLSLALRPWAGEPCVGLGSLTPQEGTSQPHYPLDFYQSHVGVGPACSLSLPLLPVSVCFFLYILSYRTSVQLDFRWF